MSGIVRKCQEPGHLGGGVDGGPGFIPKLVQGFQFYPGTVPTGQRRVGPRTWLKSSGKGDNVHLSCTGIIHRGTLPTVTVAEHIRDHNGVIGDASWQDTFGEEIDAGSRVDPPLFFGGAFRPSEWQCQATQNCVAPQVRFGHSRSCPLRKGFRKVPVKHRPRRPTLTSVYSTNDLI